MPEETPVRDNTNLVNSLKSGAYTALWTFIALFGISLLGFLQEVAGWATQGGAAPFPSTSTLGFAFVSAIVAAASGIVGTVVRLVQSTTTLIPGGPPRYDIKATPPADVGPPADVANAVGEMIAEDPANG
jgi:hypothetical protein